MGADVEKMLLHQKAILQHHGEVVDLHVGGDGAAVDRDGDVAALGRDDGAPLLAPRGGGGLDEGRRFLFPKQHDETPYPLFCHNYTGI